VRSALSLRRIVEIGYVIAIAALTAFATSNPNEFRNGAWIAALVLSLPMLLAALPVLYLAAAVAWNLTDADNGGLRWPVTATYVLVLVLAALLNVALWRSATTTRQRRIDNDSAR
jgi:uncharacterized membrane protein YqjE